jgi:hypothetical protein
VDSSLDEKLHWPLADAAIGHFSKAGHLVVDKI